MSRRAHIVGLGVVFPQRVRTNDDWPADFAERHRLVGDRTLLDIPQAADEAGRISAEFLAQEARDPFLGAVERRVADAAMTAVEVEVEAARAALRDANIDAAQLDYVISWSVVPDRVSPASANAVAHRIGAGRATAFGVDAGCASTMMQLETARGMVASGAADHVLLTQSHLMTRVFPDTHPASPGVGDCATALVVSKNERWPILATYSRTDGRFYDAVTWCRGRDDESDPPWYLPGGGYYLGSRQLGGAKFLMEQTVGMGAETVRALTHEASLDLASIRVLASVQPRGWIPLAIARCLGLDDAVAERSYERYAHLGGCGPLVNWHQARERGALDDGGLLVLYAQGSGVTRAAAAVEVAAS